VGEVVFRARLVQLSAAGQPALGLTPNYALIRLAARQR
jgi:hypothetical protein